MSAPLRAALLLGFCWMLAGAATASAQITLTVQEPFSEIPYGDGLPVRVDVTSASPVTSVQAAVSDRTVALIEGSGTWTGSVSLAGLPRGSYVLTVTATNMAAETQQASRTITLDRPPLIVITDPAENALGHPELRVRASCVDDGPTCLMRVGSGVNQGMAAGEGSIDALIAAA